MFYFKPRPLNNFLQIRHKLVVHRIVGGMEHVDGSRTRPVEDPEHGEPWLTVYAFDERGRSLLHGV